MDYLLLAFILLLALVGFSQWRLDKKHKELMCDFNKIVQIRREMEHNKYSMRMGDISMEECAARNRQLDMQYMDIITNY